MPIEPFPLENRYTWYLIQLRTWTLWHVSQLKRFPNHDGLWTASNVERSRNPLYKSGQRLPCPILDNKCLESVQNKKHLPPISAGRRSGPRYTIQLQCGKNLGALGISPSLIVLGNTNGWQMLLILMYYSHLLWPEQNINGNRGWGNGTGQSTLFWKMMRFLRKFHRISKLLLVGKRRWLGGPQMRSGEDYRLLGLFRCQEW